MKSPLQKFGVWSLIVLMSGGCGSMQRAYENYLHDEILNRGQWTMTLDAGVGQKGLEGRVVVSGCVDVEVEAAHDEFVPINQPQPTTDPGTFQPSPAVKPAWTPRAVGPTNTPAPTVGNAAPYRPAGQPAPVTAPKSTPAPRFTPPAAQPVRERTTTVENPRPSVAPTNTTRPAPVTQPAPQRTVPQPAQPAPARVAVPATPAAPMTGARPAAPTPRNATQPTPAPAQGRPRLPEQPAVKPTPGVALPRAGALPVSPVQASPAATPTKGAPAIAPAAPAGAGLRKTGRPRLNIPGQRPDLEGSDDTSIPASETFASLAQLGRATAEEALAATASTHRFTAQNGDDWEQPEAVPATQAPSGFTVVHVPARYENRCETWGVPGAAVKVVVGNVEASATTEKDGRFYISDGNQLAQLQAAGDAGVVTASLRGKTAQAALRLGGLNEVAAFRLLDAMTRPTTEQVVAFVQEWRGTDAAALAVDRFGPQACGEFRNDWDEMMATAEMPRILAVQGRYQGAWTEVFAEPCAREIAMLPTLEDMASELGLLGTP